MDSSSGTRDIVRQVGVTNATDRIDEQRELWRAEHLAIPGTGHIQFNALPSDDDVSAQMARRVAQDPTDARLHVARVNHHLLRDEPNGLYAALVDVFFAFGPTGAGLRSRLLGGARRQIGAERAALLDPYVDTGLTARSSLPFCPGSMLSNGITGETAIVSLTAGVRT
ncbi:MAG: hypothetical protein Q7V57_12855 [Actinomycetota bacterium]|nr:hypothetical protein [Actinomycetota bacterium]